MIYLHCPRCRLAITCRADYLMILTNCPRCRLAITCRADYLMILTNCPRCLAHAAIAAPLFASPLNGAELHAAQPPAPARAAELVHTPRGTRRR